MFIIKWYTSQKRGKRWKNCFCFCVLQVEENEALRKAHDRRRERICVFQDQFKTVKDQLTDLEKSNGM